VEAKLGAGLAELEGVTARRQQLEALTETTATLENVRCCVQLIWAAVVLTGVSPMWRVCWSRK
jgi:hypothetical protein